MRTLTAEQARSFYDRFGKMQDLQVFYEAAALDVLVTNAHLSEADSVLEFGCGTGRLALELIRDQLSPTARYIGVDISETMVGIASERLAAFPTRASVIIGSCQPGLPFADDSVDRFLSTYVFDLLSEPAIRRALAEARRVLRSGGLLCVAGITHGSSALSRVVMSAWQRLFRVNPAWVGGCRPLSMKRLLPESEWRIEFHGSAVAWGIASEILIAAPRPSSAAAV